MKGFSFSVQLRHSTLGWETSDCRGSLKLVTCASVTGHTFLCPTHSEAQEAEMLESGTEKGLLQGDARRKGGSCPPPPQNSELPEGFSKAFLKVRWGRGVPGYVISSCTTLWVVDGWWTVSVLRGQKVWRLCAPNHQVVLPFSCGFRASEKLRKCVWDIII